MRSAVIAAALLTLPALADARPITAGASVGRIQSKADADSGGPASETWNLFGRVGFTPRLGGQLEIQKIEGDVDVRSATGLLVVELGNQGGHLIPLLVAGFGFDHASTDWYEASGTHTEGGLGLEYRADGGFTIGADVRLGGRSVEESTEYYPALGGDDIALWAPVAMQAGEYRSARLYAAIRF